MENIKIVITDLDKACKLKISFRWDNVANVKIWSNFYIGMTELVRQVNLKFHLMLLYGGVPDQL